jgi:hypothetical protein
MPAKPVVTVSKICVANMRCGLGFLGQGFTVKNLGQGRGGNGKRFEENGD